MIGVGETGETCQIMTWITRFADLVLANTPKGQKLRNKLSKNYTLARKNADPAERIAQLYLRVGLT